MASELITNSSLEKMVHFLNEMIKANNRLDIITNHFEIALFLYLDDWQSLDKIRIIIGSPELQNFQNELRRNIYNWNELSIERFKQQNDDLSGLIDVSKAIQSRKIEIVGHFKGKLHGAGYFLGQNSGYNAALVGSSQFSFFDQHYKIELNTTVPQDHLPDLAVLFNKLYKQSEEIGTQFLPQINRHTRTYNPYEVYLKSLYEYFRDREIPVGVWEEEESKIYPILSNYQKDAYRQLLRIANLYNGALLCDGVGLGKTFVSLMLIERMIQERKRVVVIVPKSAREAVWETALKQYIPDAKSVFGNLVVIYNHTDLLRGETSDRNFPAEFDEIQKHADVIIVDEAHHFRTPWAKRSQKLFEISEGKQVFLLTATPINNSLFDLQHLIEFFTRRNDGRFSHLGINSTRGYLIQKEKIIEKQMQTYQADGNSEESLYADFDTTYAENILNDDRLFREVVVQRSRTYVKQQETLYDKKTLFPERQTPNVAKYSLQSTYGPLLDSIRDVFNRDDPLLKLAIYYPITYAKRPSDSPEDLKEANRQKQVVGLVRTTLLKRFESSWRAFQFTCIDLLLKLSAHVRQLDPVIHEKWRNANALWLNAIEDLLRDRYDMPVVSGEVEEDDIFDLFLEDIPYLDPRLFNIKALVQDTLDDMDILINFLSHLKDKNSTSDHKFVTLLSLLKEDPVLSKHKVVIFTEFRDTARYLFKELSRNEVLGLVQIDSTSKVDRLEVIRRFSPFSNYDNHEKAQKALTPPIPVLISTDILSEGLNLQDAFLLINYDLHWNPVRLMQRIGRVDRRMDQSIESQITKHNPDEKEYRGKIWYWNFLPPEELNDILSLYKRVTHKVLKISETTGLEGAQLLTPDDHFNTLKNFNEAYEGRPSIEERLRLTLNEALHNEPELEKALANYPNRLFSAKLKTSLKSGLFACYRLPALAIEELDSAPGELRWYFLPDMSENVFTSIEEIDRHIQSIPNTPRADEHPLVERYKRLDIIENHIKINELKKRKATTMAQVAGDIEDDNHLQLVAWMEVN